MYSVQIVMFLMLNSALRNINEASSTSNNFPPTFLDIQIPEDQTIEQYAQEMASFWTDERIKAAVPMPLIRSDSLSTIKNMSERRGSDEKVKPTVIEGTLPVSPIALRRDGYPNTVGKVFFVDGSGTYMCSASVVTAENKDLIFTAGHCVYSTTNRAFMKKLVFIPQYENNIRPYGTWPARSLYTMPDWSGSFNHSSDVAIVLLYPLKGQHVQDVVGSQGVSFNNGHSAVIYAFGYPINYQNAEVMTSCTATKYFPGYSTFTGDAMSCTMKQGCSGGPWFESFSFSTLSGIQTSVNSFMLSNVPDMMFGPYFGSGVQSMYNEARDSNSSNISKANNRTSPAVLLIFLLLVQQYIQNPFLN